jgi:hypothetical protein
MIVGGESEMNDPVTGAVVLAKAMGSAKGKAVSDAGSLLSRLLGPAVDAFGAALARSVEYRTRNFGRIASKADRKSKGNRGGIVNVRAAFVMLEEGALCDNELTAEYLGGVLAGARTPSGQDDRAVSWIKVISGLSALSVRAHYLLYREWADRLPRQANLGMIDGRRMAMLDVELHEFEYLLNLDLNGHFGEAANYVVQDLMAASLVGPDAACGLRSEVAPNSAFENVLRVQPSMRGCELYGWAQGLAGLHGAEFTAKAEVFDVEPPIPRLEKVAFTTEHGAGDGESNGPVHDDDLIQPKLDFLRRYGNAEVGDAKTKSSRPGFNSSLSPPSFNS